ncbi:unnamed protein product [Adineta steineri]|uniref:Carrier domain-containing protein n=1 Tax=Adineta steineri TaxID=433720 RepID=A0A815K2T8_9BILA|nr:unnamed protein product [Adineta steineri]
MESLPDSIEFIQRHIYEKITDGCEQKSAVILGEQSLTYAELIHCVQQLTLDLITKYQVQRTQVVCLCVERSIEMIIGAISITMCGAAYCALYPDDPVERLTSLVNQVHAEVVLVHDRTKMKFDDVKDNVSIVEIKYHQQLQPLTDAQVKLLSNVSIDLKDILYIIFTSGSTGAPKGAQLTHRNLLVFMDAIFQLDMMNSSSVVLQLGPCSSDIHVLEIIGPLYFGGTIIMLPPNGNIDLGILCNTLEKQEVTFAFIVPTLMKRLAEFICDPSNNYPLTFQTMRILWSGGEASNIGVIKTIFPYLHPVCKYYNVYGPTECTILATYFLITSEMLAANTLQSVPIGIPFPHYSCILLDENLKPASTLETGELYIRGNGLFPGYFGRDDLTNKVLIKINGILSYKTGDIMKIDEDNNIHFLGRSDFQIKLNGKRMEVGEIEQTILNFSDLITNCVVIKSIDHEKSYEYLIGYIQTSMVPFDEVSLTEYCHRHLPSHMVPVGFVALQQFPLNRNAKIDRKALTMIKPVVKDYVGPKDEVEKNLVEICQNLLNMEQISFNDNLLLIGAHSILINQIKSKIQQRFKINVPIKIFYEYPVLSMLAEYLKKVLLEQQEKEQINLLDLIENDISVRYKSFPTTEIQQSYLFGRMGYIELGQVSCFAYRECDFSINFDIEKLEHVLNHLIQRHETLRIIFPTDMEQIILENVPHYTINIFDLNCNISFEEQLTQRRIQLSHEVRLADKWPLFNIQVTRWIVKGEYQFRLHIGFDVLILDLWSLNLILSELSQLYYDPNTNLSAINISYRDYILTERKMKDMLIYKRDQQYWLNRLESFPLGPKLPFYNLPSELQSQKFIRLTQILDKKIWQQLKQTINKLQFSPAGFLAAVYGIVLAKWSEDQHFAINLPIFSRLPIHPQVNQLAGDFTTVIPLEIHYYPQIILKEFIRAIQKQLWSDLEHIFYTGVTFIRDLMRINNTRNIILPYVFTCGIDVNDSLHNNDINLIFEKKTVYNISQTPQIYLDNIVEEDNSHLIIHWDYIDNLFPPNMINDMLYTYTDLLRQLALSDDIWKKPLFLSISNEQQQRRFNFNNTQWKSNLQEKFLHTMIIEQAKQTPNSWAIFTSQINLTYKQLMDKVYPLAYFLYRQGAKPNKLIGILMKKGWEQIVSCLAILLSGAAYLPLDIDSPYDRISALIEQCNVKIILTQSNYQSNFENLLIIPVDTFNDVVNSESFFIEEQKVTDLAYVIFTSGSTGIPKGVMINHQAALNTILDINSRLELSTKDRIFGLSHLNFDLSVYDIFGILSAGGTIVIPDHDHYKNPEHWYDMITKYHVTIWNSVPMLMQMFVEHLKHTNNHQELRHILLSGDWIPLSLSKSIHTTFGEQVTITSLGGATEASIWSIAYTLPKEILKEWKSIPYGIPLRNQHYYVYDIHLHDCPEWVTGELYIGGEGLANGYWNDQEKTRSSFIIHPLTNKRLYRTGDYGRFLPNGYIEFMGRKDFQVKVHGHRIELGEIEHHLQQHPDIHQAIVNIDDNSQHLIGYVMPEKNSIHNKEYDSTEMLMTDSIERISFKLARHGIKDRKKVEKSFTLTKPKLTETLINTYYMRKSYRQFTNEIIERSIIEKLLKNCHNSNNNEKISLSHLDFDILSQLLAVLTPISISDEPLPKYRYASIDDLYSVQVYIELPTSIDNISPGVYYHNPDEHTLELISTHINNEMMDIRLHLVGRSSAITPLYGKRLGSQFCMLETGYIMGLLEKEGSTLGLTFSNSTHNEAIASDILNINENDTHCCFKISPSEQNITNNVQNDDHQCIIYLKSVNDNKDQWFTYNKENDTVTPFHIETEITQEEIPLFFDDDNDAKIIFYDCQCAIFFIGRSECTFNIGKMSHVLMDHCLEMNIGMCPISARTSFPKQINDVLDSIVIHEKLNGSCVLHTLLIGKISNKQKSERTISEVKSISNWSETLRLYLRKKLPMYMVPSHFMSVSSFPLSANGKINRKALPKISLSVLQQEDSYNAPNTELEKTIANIWQEILYTDRLITQHDNLESNKLPFIANVSGTDRQTSFLISTTTSFFSVGGNSLLLVKTYQHYQSKLNFESEALSIRSFFDYNTIVEHAKLLETVIIDGTQLKQWHTLHINEGVASYAQERIFLDEQVRFSEQSAIYNELTVVKVTKGLLSVNRLLRALRYVLSKHKILRTSLVFDDEDSILKQSITDKHLIFTLAADQTFKSETELHNIVSQINTNPNLFDLSSGRVFYCQILRQQVIPDENHDKEIIKNSDVLVIGFHHIAIDHSTFPILFNDLCNSYNSNMTWFDDEESLQYIDYSVHERLINMTPSGEFWRSQLNGYNQECRLSLPVDRHCLYHDKRSVYVSVAHISFDNDILTSFLDYASSHQVTPFQLSLATFYAFLFKSTYPQNDLCISSLSANRYRTELQNMAGMFISTLPYRIQLDPQWSFDELVKHVQQKCLSILEHSHYPLQNILRDSHLNQSTVSFLQTLLNFVTVTSVDDQFTFDDVSLQLVSVEQFPDLAKFDFMLKLVYNPILDDNILSCSFICSRDLFEDTTVTKMIQRFQYLFKQLFSMNFNVNQPDLEVSPIAKVTLILPDEVNEMQRVAFYRQSNVSNEAPASFAQARIWLDERIRFDPDNPQVAIYNMPFVYRLQPGHTLSTEQFRHALHLTVNKHPSLHTSLVFDTEMNLLMQRVITDEHKNSNNNLFSIKETIYKTDEQLNQILHDEKRNPHLFDLAQGLVFRCHIVYYKQISSDHLLSHKDLLIFNFHHALFDFSSMKIFLHDLNQAYTTGQLLYDNNTNLRYLDYAVIEQQMPMTGASMFWFDALHDCKLDQSLSLPFDRYRLANEHRTGRGTSISFDFDQDLSHDFLIHASSNNISLEQLALTTYYMFLFKLTNGENDLCIGINTHGRYRDDLNSIIGMFVNAIPLRCQLDPHLSFHELTKHVQDSMINSMKYSYFPLQHILNQHPNISNPVFLDTSFEFILSMAKDEEDEIMIGDTRFSLLPYSIQISEDEVMSKFDFILSFQHDLNLNEFSCTVNASLDLFNAETICIIAQRLQKMLHQQFTSFDCTTNKPVYELSLILSNEQYLMQSLNNTQISFPSSITCIHHEFVCQVMKHPQKLAVELDEQSLTYCELLYYVQILSLSLLSEYLITPGEIVCQCVERSLSMVIGIMGIEMAGGVYCPLSPRDPQHRLHALIQQTQSRLVLVHYLTKMKSDHDIVSLDIDSILNVNNMDGDMNYNCLSSVKVKGKEIAYIIFTSGSTGIPKAIQARHENLIHFMNSLVRMDVFNKDDTVVQIGRCSFDIHVQEIIGTLMRGATLAMVHPGGTLDFDYLSNIVQIKQITYMFMVPSLLQSFFTFIEQSNKTTTAKYFRSLCSGGEPFSVKLSSLIANNSVSKYNVWNYYGPAEITIACTLHLIDIKANSRSIPIGRSLPNYRCLILNKFLQSTSVDQEGELFVGGAGVFAGYLERDDLTAKALVEIDGQLFYRTGDLVRMDSNGLLHYQGRKDHQIKLHGQRIELGEIERCLLNITSISACVVMKWNDDYLVAYVQSSDINEEELRQQCQSHLPPHMVPSIFIVLDKLPLNANGKIDRKQLPSPDYSLSTFLSSDKSDTPLNQFEERIHTIWRQVLHCNESHISKNTSFFTVGGHSLLFIELYHHYQSVFNFDAHSLSITPFLQQPTIFQHSQLLQTVIMNNVKTTQWYTLHINEGVASFAQERIFLDEQVRFSSDIAIYNELSTLQIVQGSISFNRLLQAFRYVLNKHRILRTSLMLNNDNSSLKQCITKIHKTFTITMNQTFGNENELRDIIYQTTINPTLFDLSTGRVFHAEILRHQISSNDNENNSHEFISNSDVLLIAFHHAAFDRASRSIFFNDLCLGYNTNTISIEDDESLQYIDYSIHERLIDMTTSREFWYLQLERYNFESRLSLPVDRHRLPNDHRSSSASVTQISFDNEISQSFLDYASTHHVTPFQLGLSILYAFLFKLTHGENDLCISCVNANRYKTKLQNIIGMFVSTLPYRIQLDPQWSFDKLVKYVREECLSILEHSHYPLQHILANLHIDQSNISFLETMFDFITLSSHSDKLSLDGASFKQVLFDQSFEVAKFDFMLTFIYDPILENNKLSFHLTCSHDLFDEITVTNMSRRLKYCFQQLFSSNETINRIDTCSTFISKINLILREETQEMEDTIFCRQSHIMNEAPASYAQALLYHNESIHFAPHISQVPVYNMPFPYHLHLHHTLSIQHLRHALQLIVRKHESLRTSLLFDTEKNIAIQRIIDMNDNSTQLFIFTESTYETQEQLNGILSDEKYSPHHFDLAQGLVFRCHIVYYKQISSNNILSDKDIVIFNFHHACFDYPSINIFLHDLDQAYKIGQLTTDDATTVSYIDYAVIEQQMSMTGASMFWLDTLYDYHLDQSLSLPYDRYRLMNEHRTDRATSISFDFGQDLSHHLLLYASSNNIKHEHLVLAIYFIFLFKLTNGEKDLCIAMNTNNRYRDELKSIIGLFENIIPLRCQLDSHCSFHYLLEYVREITTNSMKYSYFPLQRILNQYPNVSKPAFLDISFEFISSIASSDNKLIMIGDGQLSSIPFTMNTNDNEIRNKFDFSLLIQHDLNINQLSCTINASLDLFNVKTIDKICQQFHSILEQLFTSVNDQIEKSIYEISLTLPNERLLIQSMNNTQVSFPSSITCIHHEFVYQVMKHPQKLAVELDEQSLTYCELLYYVQVLALTLVNEYRLLSGEIVCQCVERSLSMVIGIMGIEMAGGVYCPLSPRDPQHRLHALIQQTQSRLVLVHWLTKNKFNDTIVSFDVSSILTYKDVISDIDADKLSNVIVTVDDIAYIIFTSGSTGIPKPAQLRHRNFTQSIRSLVLIDVFNKSDTVVQIARCSFDIHVQEIVGTIIIGERCSLKLIQLLQSITDNCHIWNLCGPAETTLQSLFHQVNLISDEQTIPLGIPLPNYRCIVQDNFDQSQAVHSDGELLVSGAGIFAGYLGRDDLSAKAFIYINDELFYRTGDLVLMDNKGLIHYVGRKDHQIKLHGQRIELGEIEQCLLRTSISACVVIKWNDDQLVAYIQSSDIDEKVLREHCQSHLPPHMIPSFFVILDKLPLNANGKIDRKLLPPPDFLSLVSGYSSNVPSTSVEQQLQKIFSQAFHIESPPIEVPFGQLGGTSLDAIRALTLIRQQIYTNIDIGLLFTNPSIRQLAQAIEPFLILNQSQETVFTANQSDEAHARFLPSFVIESVGIVFLVSQWLCPIIIIHQWCPLFFPILPAFHLLFYVICSRLFSPCYIKTDNLFSWNYYRWWFLDRLWNNNTFWLKHILGTPFYNYYLRLCGARINLNTHIYTTIIDAPWLLEIDDGSWIANETCLNCLYFNDDNTFKLSPIRIGSNCSIGTRSILFDGVDMQNNIIVQPMSLVTGFIASETIIDGEEHKYLPADISIVQSNRSLSIWHKIYQIIAIISIICIHCTLLVLVCKVYSVGQIPLPISITFCWTLWSIIGCFISLLLLKFIVGPCTAGEIYPIASRLYLQKIWLRQLIVSSFHHAWLLPTSYDYLYPFVLRWLGAQVEDDVKLYEIDTFLSCPTNLLKFGMGVTTFRGVLIVPTELTLLGNHRVDQIMLGSHTNLANGCSILPGSCLESETMIGNLTRISRETKNKFGEVLMGVPARTMPFQLPPRPKIQDQIDIIPFWHTCLSHYASKCLLLSIYSFGGLVGGSIIHTMLVCGLYRCHSYIRHEIVQQIIIRMSQDYAQFICPFLGNTQWLIRLFRAYGAHIGENNIVPDISCIVDYHLITIRDDVRLNVRAHIQGHSFEQRILKLAPVSIGNSCVLMSSSIVMSGCKLMGNNRLYPGTLIMKNDQLPPNTHWKGIPAQSYTVKARLSRPTIVHDDLVKYQQGYETINKLFLWYERIASIYTNVNELQFMNYGYADVDEYIDDHTGYYSRKLYEQVFANVTLTDQNILEVGCGRGAGAAWCVRTYAPRSYVGIDPSQDVINLCQQYYSTIPQLSFMIADPKTHLPFQNESMNVVLSIETTNTFDEIEAVKQFVNEITRVLTPNGYFLWCGLCNVDGSNVLIDYLTANNAFIINEKVNITRNVLHALDIQSNSCTDFIERYIQPADQEYCRLLAGLPGTQLYDNMQRGGAEYYRVVFRKKITKGHFVFNTKF